MNKSKAYIATLIVLFAILAYLTFKIVRPVIAPIFISAFFAYVFYPVYRWIRRKIKNENISAFIISFTLIILISIPLFFIVNAVSKEAYIITLLSEKSLFAEDRFLGVKCEESNFFCDKIIKSSGAIKLQYYLKDNIETVRSKIIESSTTFIFSIPKRLIDIFLTLFIMFYLFRDGEKLYHKLRAVLALPKQHEAPLIKKVGDVTYALIYGTIVVGIVEGIFGGIGFWLFDIPSPILWGMVMAILAILPMVGGIFIWVPAAIFMFAKGHIGTGLLFVLYNLIFVTGPDMFIRPLIYGNKAKTHPAVILIGVFGGIAFLGLVGFIIGPLILTLLLVFFEIYEKERFGIDLEKTE